MATSSDCLREPSHASGIDMDALHKSQQLEENLRQWQEDAEDHFGIWSTCSVEKGNACTNLYCDILSDNENDEIEPQLQEHLTCAQLPSKNDKGSGSDDGDISSSSTLSSNTAGGSSANSENEQDKTLTDDGESNPGLENLALVIPLSIQVR